MGGPLLQFAKIPLPVIDRRAVPDNAEELALQFFASLKTDVIPDILSETDKENAVKFCDVSKELEGVLLKSVPC